MDQVENVKYGGDGSFWSKMVTCTQKSHPLSSITNASLKKFETTDKFVSILGNARYPTRGNVRATLPSVPTAEELGDEDEFQLQPFLLRWLLVRQRSMVLLLWNFQCT